MTPVDIEKLRAIPIFSALNDESLKRIATLATEFEAPKGQVLIQPGYPGAGVFIIEEGSVRIDLPNGRRIDRAEGSFFGELSVLAATPRTARVSASSDLRALAIRRDDLLDLLRTEPSIAVSMLQEVATRLVSVVTEGPD